MTSPHTARFSGRRLVSAVVLTVLIAVVGLTGCSAPAADTRPSASAGILADHGLSGLETRQVIERLDAMPVADRPSGLLASVRPDALVLTDDQDREMRMAMPDDEFYVSIAPYVDKTHDCYYHSLTTCLGELRNQQVQVTVTNNANGEVVLDQTLRTFDNGFFGVWLPRNLDATLTVAHDGRTATSAISTARGDDPTCLTTFQLT